MRISQNIGNDAVVCSTKSYQTSWKTLLWNENEGNWEFLDVWENSHEFRVCKTVPWVDGGMYRDVFWYWDNESYEDCCRWHC